MDLPIFRIQRKVSGRVFDAFEYCTLRHDVKVASLIRQDVVVPPSDKQRYADLKKKAEQRLLDIEKARAAEAKKLAKKKTPTPKADAAQAADAPD